MTTTMVHLTLTITTIITREINIITIMLTAIIPINITNYIMITAIITITINVTLTIIKINNIYKKYNFNN